MSGPAPSRYSEDSTTDRVGRRYRAPLLVRELPPEVAFGFLERVLPTTEPLELHLELVRIPPEQALAMVERARTAAEVELTEPGRGAESSRLEVERTSSRELGLAIARRSQELWRVGLSFVATGSGRVRVDAVRARLSDRLAALGFRPRIPRYEVSETLRAGSRDSPAPGRGATGIPFRRTEWPRSSPSATRRSSSPEASW